MDLLLFWTSFLAGVLTILAPCVLPLLPVIVGGAAASKNKKQPLIMTLSLVLSIILFTLLLKATTLLIDVPPWVWKSISGGIILVFGLFTLFPEIWEKLSLKLNLLGRSQTGLAKAGKTHSTWSGVWVGAALGPVFSSCSPTYFVILATVLPVSFALGLFYLLVYGLGLGIMLGLIAFFGQKLTLKLGWAADSRGFFKRILGVLLVLVGIGILTGLDKKIESTLIEKGFGTTQIEENLINDISSTPSNNLVQAPLIKEDLSIPLGELQAAFAAPELAGLENWINTPPIRSMEELKGKVVLIDFWTYSCINCIRTLPYLQAWHERYANEGLVILGVHAPEFSFERKIENVRKAVEDFGLTYPVVQDNKKTLWNLYHNRYWPAKYLIDQNGVVRYAHFGEGEYEETEKIIAQILNTAKKEGQIQAQEVDFSQIGTPETYIGLARRENYMSPDQDLADNQWTLKGAWSVDDEKAVNQESNTAIRMNFIANKANLVMSGKGEAEVWIDGQKANASNAGADVSEEGVLTFDGYRLYELTDFNMQYNSHTIELRFSQPGVELFAWTFS